MKVLISIEHPAWAHQFKYIIRELEKKGHTVKVLAINKDRDLELLNAFKIPYEVISDTSGITLLDKGTIFLKTLIMIFFISLKFKPDIFIGRASPMMSINSFLFHKPHIIFEDSEPANFSLCMARLFSTVVITPEGFKKNLGNKHIRVKAYKELFYLHPNYFIPDNNIPTQLGLAPGEKYVILRFVAWQAHHDRDQHGFDTESKLQLITEIEKVARVFITSEVPLEQEFEKYQLTLPFYKIHDILYYATLLVTDSQTMTTEAAVLGTPAIRCNTFVGPTDMSNFIELENQYHLIYNLQDTSEATARAKELLSQKDLKSEWHDKCQKMLTGKIDVTQFMLNTIDRYINKSSSLTKREYRAIKK